MEATLSLSTEAKEKIGASFFQKKYAKGSHFIRAGEYCEHIAFLSKGKMRVYYLDGQGQEITCYFAFEKQFISSFTSFLTQMPTRENIEAIEDSEAWLIDRRQLEILSREVPQMETWRRIVAENLFIMMERRITMLQSKTAQERYEAMIRDNPDLVLKIPLQYTASFLGITPQHLSRLRKKVKEQKG